MKISFLVFTLAVPFSCSVLGGTGNAFFIPGALTGDIGLGSLSGQTRERVYEPDDGGRKVSQLNWKYSHAAIIKGALNWDLHPRISLGASGWTTLAGRGGYMDDTDWLDESAHGWTDKSWHPDTRLNYASEFDLHVKGWLMTRPDWRVGVMAGYQESRYSFTASGGAYQYTDEDTGEPNTGHFPDGEKGIGYSQHFKMPYIGLVGRYRHERFEFGGSAKYSGWVRASDNDEHYQRNTTFRDKVRNQNYFALTADAGYYVTPDTRVYLEGVWSRLTNKKGSLTAIEHDTGKVYHAGNSSGIESYNFMTTAGLKYTF